MKFKYSLTPFLMIGKHSFNFISLRRRLHESEVNSRRSEISRRSESGLCLHGATFMKCTSKLVPLYLFFQKKSIVFFFVTCAD